MNASFQKRKVHLSYSGSRFWVIFWAVIFFPVAVAMMATSFRFELDQTAYSLAYDGSRFWLCFWLVFLFPVAFVLLILNGFSIITEPANTGLTGTGSTAIAAPHLP